MRKTSKKSNSSTRMYFLLITFTIMLTFVLNGASSAHQSDTEDQLCTEEISEITEYISITDMVSRYIENEKQYSAAPATEIHTIKNEISAEEKQKRYEAQKAYYQDMAERYHKEAEANDETTEEQIIIASETYDEPETYEEET